MASELYHLTIAEAAPLLERRQLSPVELTRAFLDRIAAVNPLIDAYVCVTSERAMADARRAEAEIADGAYRGPLHGIPIALKDIYDTEGISTTCHSHLHADRVPEHDSRAAALLRDAGTVLLGKLATHEFAFGGPAWDLPFPPARNPWDPECFTGGSSSGSGAAVAAGLAMGSLGSDTGGSIRVPAFFCGITGVKPTYGRVSRRGVTPLAYSLDHCGPMTWTARDAALMLQGVAGHDPQDPASSDAVTSDYVAALTGDVSGLRIGLIRHFYDGDTKADDDVRKAMDASAATFGQLGATVEEVRLSSLHDFHACCMIIMLTEALAVHHHELITRPEKYGAIVRDRLTLASLLTGLDYVQATRMRRQLAVEVNRALEDYDLLLTAGGLTGAPKLQEISKFYLLEEPLLTTPFDVTGNPTIAVCNGATAKGLPVGMQIVGRNFGEATVLRAADAFERATDWRKRRPSLSV